MTNNIPFGYPIYLLIKFQSNNFNDSNETDYYLSIAKHNTINYVYTYTVFAKIKTSDGTIKTIKHVN